MSRVSDLIRRDDTLPETTVPLCLNGELQAAFERAQRDMEQVLADAEAGGARRGRRLADADPIAELRERLGDLAEQMQPFILPLRLRAMSRPQWRALRSEHPPRRDDDGNVLDVDLAVGVNIETFFDALVAASIVGAEDGDTVEPISDSDLRVLLEQRISDGQWKALADAAWSINRRDVDVPFSRPSSKPTRNS